MLRKACRSCTKAKRKCTVQLPTCIRCLKKGLDCTYDLEPLSSDQTWGTKELTVAKSTATFPRHCYLGLVELGDCDGHKEVVKKSTLTFGDYCYLGAADARQFRFTISKNAFWNNFGYIMWVMDRIPGFVASGEISILVHPKLQFLGERDYLKILPEVLKAPQSMFLDELVKIDISDAPLYDAITAIQTLIIYLIKYLFATDLNIQTSAMSCLPLLANWTQLLLSTASTKIPSGLSPWQAWLLGETTRRTIILSYFVSCTFKAWKHQVCRPDLVFEALPFDRRVGLWEAMTPQAWISAARAKNGQEVGTQLVSVHEFGHSFPKFVNPGNDTFLTLILVSHNGKERTQADITCLASEQETAKMEQELADILGRVKSHASTEIVLEIT